MTTEEVTEAEVNRLNSLDIDDLIILLAEAGCKGERENAEGCPIANYFAKKFDCRAHVDTDGIALTFPAEGVVWDKHTFLGASNGTTIGLFIEQFDAGNIPELRLP